MPKELSLGNFDGRSIGNEASLYFNEFERQISNFLKLGFHTILGLSLEDYFSSMPKPDSHAKLIESFDKFVIVEPRIPSQLQLMQAGYYYYVRSSFVYDAKTSKVPYIALLKTDDVRTLREVRAPDLNSPTIQEGTALLTAHPEVIDHPPIALLGSKIYSLEGNGIQEKIPCTYKWSGGQAGIGSDLIGCLEEENAQTATCIRIH